MINTSTMIPYKRTLYIKEGLGHYLVWPLLFVTVSDISHWLDKRHEITGPSEFKSRELHNYCRSVETGMGERSTGNTTPKSILFTYFDTFI